MVLSLAIGCNGYDSAAGYWKYCGTGHDHLRAMGLELITSVKTIGCAVMLDAQELGIFRMCRCNVGPAMYFDVTSTLENQKTKK